jgi:hypothetical protein
MYLYAGLITITYACWHFRYEHPEISLIALFNLVPLYLILKISGAFKTTKGW